MIKRSIPSSGEKLPVIGLGTWQTFDVKDPQKMKPLAEVLQTMLANESRLIDTSPMYGHSEETIGVLTANMDQKDDFFYATKVWIKGKEEGIHQMQDSLKKMKRSSIDLMQIHNLVDWKTHFKTLQDWKQKGIIKYIGITHYMDNMHDELADIISNEKIDFVQFNYSVFSRNAEKRLLPVAAEKGVATLINRPFGEGKLFGRVKDKKVPSFSKELDINNWSQFFLKYILSNKAVTCIIPGTSNPQHMLDNIVAGQGNIPDEITRLKMIKEVESYI
jgi:diketogulonate reductase-like aldo/keto reductase